MSHARWLLLLVCWGWPLPVLAQAPAVPAGGTNAVTVMAGVAVPSEELLGLGWSATVSGEHYLTPRVSLRALFGGASWAFPDFEGDSARPFFFLGSITYGRQAGGVRPYAVAGAGTYAFRFHEVGVSASAGKAGVHLGGGIEWFVASRASLAVELLLHPLGGDAAGRLADYEAAFWTVSGGYKRYF